MRNEMKRNNLLWFLLELCCIIMLPLLQPSFARSFARPSPLFAPHGRVTNHPRAPPPPPRGPAGSHP
ncbi:hypothetical protein WN944_027417 [Citrus x changshan-huyou]|uniref:Uncharacterized protein n=1 Tax=Citrus x changshan-huyou TaxID=2935761 RepID=A0AAP0LIH5_9ROSI